MQRLDRLERVTDLLLVLLDTGQPLSLREIALRVPGYPESHVALRQAFERDKKLLRDEGIPLLTLPVDGEEQLGYRIDPDAYYLPELGLDPDEQAALNVAVAGVHLGDTIGQDALLKLGVGGELPGPGAIVPLIDLPSPDALPALPYLFDAIRDGATVMFTYRGEPRRLDGAGIRFARGNWYVIGFDRDREEPRTFRVDRIDGTPEAGGPGSADPPQGFEVDSSFSLEPWQFGSGGEIEVEVLVDGAEAGRVVAEVGIQAVVERRDQGAVVLRLSVSDTEALVSWVLDLLDHAEVLGPEPVRALVIERLKEFVGPLGEDRP